MDNNVTSPTVSVIIPCYNCAEWIEKCLTALENQTYRNFEVLCVDDCSTDATYAIIESYKDHSKLNINLLKNEKNSGPAISRNRAALIAQGEWLAFCDSDTAIGNRKMSTTFLTLITLLLLRISLSTVNLRCACFF